MDETAARQEADEILAELPDRISDVIKPFARQSPEHPALVQGDVTWTYAELAAVVADTALILKLYDIRPGDRVIIVSENSLALVALILATSEIDAWSVVVNPRPQIVRSISYAITAVPAAPFIRSRCPMLRAGMQSGTMPTLPCFVGWEHSASGR
jgi:acyl-CoA synthetase (AMP-forming)/AMP-acid ligase II